MSLRKIRAVALAAAVFLTLLVVPMSAPASASHTVATICAVTGAVDVTAVGQLPFGGAQPGTYDFFDVAIVCAGSQTGQAGATSSGSTGPGAVSAGGCGSDSFPIPGTFGQFCGDYSTGAFLEGGACAGDVGGPGAWDNGSPPLGRWSLTLGPLITGWIDCNHGNAGATSGAIALVAVPMSLNTQASDVNPGGGCVEPCPAVSYFQNDKSCTDSNAADYPDDLPDDVEGPVEANGEPQVWFCRILVAGVSVIVGNP